MALAAPAHARSCAPPATSLAAWGPARRRPPTRRARRWLARVSTRSAANWNRRSCRSTVRPSASARYRLIALRFRRRRGRRAKRVPAAATGPACVWCWKKRPSALHAQGTPIAPRVTALRAPDGPSLCCDAACDGACQGCSSAGRCEVFPQQDELCEAVACPIDDVCRDYAADATASQCRSFGQCQTGRDCTFTALPNVRVIPRLGRARYCPAPPAPRPRSANRALAVQTRRARASAAPRPVGQGCFVAMTAAHVSPARVRP